MPEEQRFVLGIAYQAGPDPRITKGADGGRDYFSKEELEKACWSYMRNGPRMNAFHVEGTEDCAEPVESFIWRWDDWDAGDGIVVKDGDWLLGSILSPRMWDAKKAGRVNGYSPEGTARRRRVAKEEGAVTIAKGAAGLDGEDDELTSLSDADMTKVALVGHGANGIPRFLISKDADAAGLLDPQFVRELIGKQADPEPGPADSGQVTMTGSPAAIAKLMHEGALRFARPAAPDAVAKAKYSAEDKRKMLAAGHAIKNDAGDPAYPIGDKDDLGKAVHAVGRGGADHDRIRAYVIRRAKALGASSEIPDNWNSDGSLKEPVSKEDAMPETVAKADLGPELDGGTDGMDPTVALAEPGEMGPGDMTDPGSPAWESIDAATAQKWTSIAVRLKNALCILAEREMLEAASADPSDAENAFDLQDAQCAMDYVIDTLAGYAVDEQAEADLGGEAMEAIGKAMAAFDPAPLDVIEGLTAVRKSGRVLSAANEAHIREAAARLTTVLSSLPQAPATDDGQPVAKMTPETEAGMPEPSPSQDVTAGSGQQPAMGTAEPSPAAQEAVVAKSALALVFGRDGTLAGVANADAIVQRVAKADDGDGKVTMQAVFDENGNLVGIVDPADITPVAGAGGKSAPGDGTDGAAAPAADAADMTPQPPAEAGTPADDVAKQAIQDPGNHAVLKSAVRDALAELLGAQGPAEDVAKQADVAGLRDRLEQVAARLETVEKQDAKPGVFANGQVPPEGAIPPSRPSLRGQDQGASQQVDVAKAMERRRQFRDADPAEQNRIAAEMHQDAIDGLTAIHAGR